MEHVSGIHVVPPDNEATRAMLNERVLIDYDGKNAIRTLDGETVLIDLRMNEGLLC